MPRCGTGNGAEEGRGKREEGRREKEKGNKVIRGR
jgi:hypothetical protein